MRWCTVCGAHTAEPDAHGVVRCPDPDHPPVPATVAKTLARPAGGGYLIARIDAGHAHECGAWRMGKRHAPCSCGATDALKAFLADHADDPWSGVAGAAHVPYRRQEAS